MSKLVKQTPQQLSDQMQKYGEILYTATYKCDECKEQASVKTADNHLCIKHYLERSE